MARLSTGQSFGEVSRASAAQLLGGIPTDASAGALAQGSINAPALQPRAWTTCASCCIKSWAASAPISP